MTLLIMNSILHRKKKISNAINDAVIAAGGTIRMQMKSFFLEFFFRKN